MTPTIPVRHHIKEKVASKDNVIPAPQTSRAVLADECVIPPCKEGLRLVNGSGYSQVRAAMLPVYKYLKNVPESEEKVNHCIQICL